MSLVWTSKGFFQRSGYANEGELEAAILEVQKDLFGSKRHYLDVKKKIGAKGGLRNIPDGYLLDISDRQPRLYVVENELASHDPLRHIAVQILQFSLSFESEPRVVKQVLMNALDDSPSVKKSAEAYAVSHQFRNLDHMLDFLVHEAPFAALVVIDELPDNLENVLARKFQFGVEVLELAKFENASGEKLYLFEAFLAGVEQDVGIEVLQQKDSRPLDTSELDTVVVPAREDGFKETFLGEDRWYAVRLHGTMRPQIKYIAAYQVAPVSAITHIAPVKSIEPWKDTSKFVLKFSEPARLIGPIPLGKRGPGKALQNLRYTNRKTLENAKTIDDIW